MENIKQLLNENQDPKAVEKAVKKLNELLTRDEKIEYIAIQKKPVNISPDSVALTNKRIIFCKPKNLGLAMNFQDFLWKDIADCHMKEGLLGATFTVMTTKKYRYSVDYLPKSQARLLYRYAQEREEEMSEYRRQRELENARASAGGVVVQNTDRNDKSEKPTEDPMQSLKKLKDLLENELISQSEFDEKKAEILKRL